MTLLESKKFSLWRRLGEKLLLEDQPPSGVGASVGTVVFPVLDVDSLLRVPRIETFAGNLDIAAGALVTFFTVPAGKRWVVKSIWRQGTTAGSKILVKGPDSAVVMNMSPNTTVESVLITEFTVDPRWIIGMESTDDVGDISRRLRILYDEEDAF